MLIGTAIYTIGYGNRPASIFLNLLVKYGVSTIVDIRTRPYSRFQPSYNKKKFQAILQEQGINYLFKGDILGGKPTNQMLYTSGKLNYGLVSAGKEYQNAINELVDMAGIGEKLCLMCCELNPDICHRKTLVGESIFKRGIAVNHITAKGDIEIHLRNNLAIALF